MTKNAKLVGGLTITAVLWAAWIGVADIRTVPLAWVLGCATILFLVYTVVVWVRPEPDPVVKLRAFMADGLRLQTRCATEPEVRIARAVDKWVKRTRRWIARNVSHGEAAQFVLDTGLAGDAPVMTAGGATTSYINVIYRMRRLAELIQRLQTSPS